MVAFEIHKGRFIRLYNNVKLIDGAPIRLVNEDWRLHKFTKEELV